MIKLIAVFALLLIPISTNPLGVEHSTSTLELTVEMQSAIDSYFNNLLEWFKDDPVEHQVEFISDYSKVTLGKPYGFHNIDVDNFKIPESGIPAISKDNLTGYDFPVLYNDEVIGGIVFWVDSEGKPSSHGSYRVGDDVPERIRLSKIESGTLSSDCILSKVSFMKDGWNLQYSYLMIQDGTKVYYMLPKNKHFRNEYSEELIPKKNASTIIGKVLTDIKSEH
jgi:hypothetical protein